jgi:hypothetical protein
MASTDRFRCARMIQSPLESGLRSFVLRLNRRLADPIRIFRKSCRSFDRDDLGLLAGMLDALEDQLFQAAVPGRRVTRQSPRNIASSFIRENDFNASRDEQTIGSSASLNEVFRSTGTPQRRPKASSNWWNNGSDSRETVWARQVPKWHTAAILSSAPGQTGTTCCM